ncbi:Cysteine proteinase RD21a [Spatholobus suberectus]|nr:Cysteine proteinase RD21a [Spatholobus suberectus]
MDYAFQFIIENGGIDTDGDYPYQSVDGVCDPTKKNAKVVQIDGYKDVPPYDENALKKDMAHQPISVSTKGSGKALQLYQLASLLFKMLHNDYYIDFDLGLFLS